MKACHAAHRNILPLPELSEWTLSRVLMYQSIPSLDDPRGFAHSHCPGGSSFRPTFFARGVGFLNETFSTVWKELLDLFQRNWRQLEKQEFWCCLISIFAKTVDLYCIFNNIDHF